MNYLFFAAFQRAATAFLAMARRLAGDNAAALAIPPLDAPSLLSATAAGFLVSGTCSGSGACPVASWTTCHARWLASLERLLAREGMTLLSHANDVQDFRAVPKLDHYPGKAANE